jgi:hypothetical protein
MKYMLLIHQGTTPTPRSPDEWATLSEAGITIAARAAAFSAARSGTWR